MTHQSNFIFGYGFLVNIKNLEQYLKRKLQPDLNHKICSLKDYQRCWNVAMNNQVNLPNYKYYRDRTKQRIDAFVTFLNIRPHPNKNILGILFRVTDAELISLDSRERNYQRINITKQLDIQIQGNAWTYIGLPAAEQRYQTGLAQNKAVIDRTYFNSVEDAYLALGNKEHANYVATTDKPLASIIDLEVCRSKIQNDIISRTETEGLNQNAIA